MPSFDEKAVQLAQAPYRASFLRVYDTFVFGFPTPRIWRCPTERILQHYRENMTADHLDVGVGTGIFLDKTLDAVAPTRVALMDLNPHSLHHTATRIARFSPLTYQANVLDPASVQECGIKDPFTSIGCNYLVHCLPGTMQEKAGFFDAMMPLLAPQGVFFGSTILADQVKKYRAARRLSAMYNRRGAFNNRDDTTAGLEQALSDRFSSVHVETVGCVTFFRAAK